MSLERNEMIAAIEALLFASDTPVSLEALCEVLNHSQADAVVSCVEELKEAYASDSRGLQVVRVAGGYHIRTRNECAPWVERLLRRRRKMRLSQAALETLAIVAYRQPVTKAEIESIRGVDAGGVLGTLLERNLLAIKGRSKGPGRPLLYGTTKAFLDQFNLNDLDDLPSLEEVEALMARREDIDKEEEDRAPGEVAFSEETASDAFGENREPAEAVGEDPFESEKAPDDDTERPGGRPGLDGHDEPRFNETQEPENAGSDEPRSNETQEAENAGSDEPRDRDREHAETSERTEG